MTITVVLSSWFRGIARVHPVHLMNADSAPDGCQPSTKPNNLGCESASRLLPSTSTIAILLVLSPKAYNHFTISRRVEG